MAAHRQSGSKHNTALQGGHRAVMVLYKNGCGNAQKHRRSRFSAPQTHRSTLFRGKAVTPVSVGLLTHVSNDDLSAFSDCSNDWLSPMTDRLDTYSAGSVGTLTPFSCSARQSSCALPGHGKNYWISFGFLIFIIHLIYQIVNNKLSILHNIIK